MDRVFDITGFGAAADGVTDCTKAFQTAIDKASEVCGADAVRADAAPQRMSALHNEVIENEFVFA